MNVLFFAQKFIMILGLKIRDSPIDSRVSARIVCTITRVDYFVDKNVYNEIATR